MKSSWLVVLLVFTSRAALAEAPLPEDTLPLAADLKRAPIGSWSEYEIRKHGQPPVTVRVALIARDRTTATLEMRLDLPPFNRPTHRKMVVQLPVPMDLTKRGGGSAVIQVEGRAAMVTPWVGVNGSGFERPSTKALKGREVLVAPTGTYRARHYEMESDEWSQEVWAADTVFPLGVIKMKRAPATILGGLVGEADLKGAPAPPPPSAAPARDEPFFSGSEVMLLTATGSKARSSVTGPLRPYDATVLKQEVAAASVE